MWWAEFQDNICPGVNLKFVVIVLKMPPNCIERDVQFSGNPLVGKTMDGQFQNFALAHGEFFDIGINDLLIAVFLFHNFILLQSH